MYPDMKTFSELTAIDTRLLLEVQVQLNPHDHAVYTFSVNGIATTDPYSTFRFDLLDQLHFSCQVSAGAVEVAKITINGYEVMPVYLHLAQPPTNWITKSWQFDISTVFYPWYHAITGQGWTA